MAADGNGTCGIGLSPSKQFPYLVDYDKGSPLIASANGACDPSMGDLRERLSPFRHALGAFRGTIAAAGSPIVLAKGQELSLFVNGPTKDGAQQGLTGTLSRAETNAQEQGGVAQQSTQFVMVGAWLQPVAPWFKTSADPANVSLLDNRELPKWLRDLGTGYDVAGLSALAEATTCGVKNGPTTACEYDLGPLSLWAQGSGMAPKSNGLGGLGGQFYYLAVPDVSGGTQSGRELKVTLKLERDLSITNDAGNPTLQGAVAFPFRMVAVGYPVCDSGPAMGGGGMAAFVQALTAAGLPASQIADLVSKRIAAGG